MCSVCVVYVLVCVFGVCTVVCVLCGGCCDVWCCGVCGVRFDVCGVCRVYVVVFVWCCGVSVVVCLLWFVSSVSGGVL